MENHLFGTMLDGYDPTRPMEGWELTLVKQKMLKRYMDPTDPFNAAVVSQNFAETLYNTQDEAKLKFEEGQWTQRAQKSFHMSPEHSKAWGALQNKIPLGGAGFGPQFRPDTAKALLGTDTATGGTLIPQGIIPHLFLWMATEFLAWNQFSHDPADGPLHVWNGLLSLGDATDGYLDEWGCPPSNRGVYSQGRTNISILGFRRGESLKMQLLEQMIGFRYDGQLPMEREVENALISRARILEKTLYQGTTASGQDGTTEYGLTFSNGFNGARVTFSNAALANGVNPGVYPATFNPIVVEQAKSGTTTPITDALQAGVAAAKNKGGRIDQIHIKVSTALKIEKENSDKIRIVVNAGNNPGTWIVGGGLAGLMSTVGGFVPFTVVLDDSIGTYNIASIAANGGTTSYLVGDSPTGQVEDGYLFTSRDAGWVYIGSPDPMPIQLQAGTPTPDNLGCLASWLIIYIMTGFAWYVPIHHVKVRLLA